ncbi:MAG: glycoside hydrolase family 1 protein [Erysipelotrichaceae bacterium]|nr:glycoside hydrolase family 1 protein [Erysipelotrichaceae bacterium]
MSFPKGFYWGGAVTAHQSEGAYTEGGKSPAVCDLIPLEGPSGFKKDANFKPSTFEDGIDEYHRYEEDFTLFEELGFNSYRFSIDWSRVQPDGVHFSEEGMAFYDRFIDALIAHGMDPMCSLYHFEMPQCLYEKYNGFYSREVVDLFVTYAYKMIDRYGDRVKKWISFNEQNSIGMPGESKIQYGAVCPEGVDEKSFVNQLVHNTFVAHAKVVEKVHTIPDALALGMVIYIPVHPLTAHPLDVAKAQDQMAVMDMYFDMFAYGTYTNFMWHKWEKEGTMPDIVEGDLELFKANTCDWLTLSYYFSLVASATQDIRFNPYLEANEWGWTIDPVSLRVGLKDLQGKYRLPLMVVENGIGMRDELVDGTVIDDGRIDYMRLHIDEIGKAIDEGVDCRGYLMWGPIDILSSHAEMEKRYGVIYVNRGDYDLRDMKRYKKKSFNWYKKVIASNGEDTAND